MTTLHLPALPVLPDHQMKGFPDPTRPPAISSNIPLGERIRSLVGKFPAYHLFIDLGDMPFLKTGALDGLSTPTDERIGALLAEIDASTGLAGDHQIELDSILTRKQLARLGVTPDTTDAAIIAAHPGLFTFHVICTPMTGDQATDDLQYEDAPEWTRIISIHRFGRDASGVPTGDDELLTRMHRAIMDMQRAGFIHGEPPVA